MHDTSGPHNQPHYSENGIPADAADLTEVSDWADLVGNRKVGSTTTRNNLSGADLWPGLEFFDTTLWGTFIYINGGWVQTFDNTKVFHGGTVGIATDAGGSVIVTHNFGVAPTWIEITDFYAGGVPSTRKPVITIITSTTFTVRFFNNGNPLGGNPVQFHWVAGN